MDASGSRIWLALSEPFILVNPLAGVSKILLQVGEGHCC